VVAWGRDRGATVGNQVLVWRSGVGVDRNGGLIHIAGPGLSVNQLAELFVTMVARY
jgi:hypothetical protein